MQTLENPIRSEAIKKAIVVPFYFGSDDIPNFWNGLLKNSSSTFLVVVVNGKDRKDELALAKLDKDPHVFVVFPRKNLGFGKGINLGARVAIENGAEVLIFLNQDAQILQLPKESVEQACSGQNIICPYTWEWEVGGTFNWFFREKVLPNIELGRKSIVPYFPAWCWMLSVKTYSEVGIFDPFYFMYGEDDDYIQRFQATGGSLVLDPQFHCVHKGGMEKQISHGIQSHLKRGRLIARFNELEDHWGNWFFLKIIGSTFLELVKGNWEKAFNFKLLWNYFKYGKRSKRIQFDS